jgi:hypothetical protein
MSTKQPTRGRKPPIKKTVTVVNLEPEQTLVPYDENLLERARTQWQFGEWKSLAQLDRETLQHHPDRAKLALLAGAGRLQTSQVSEARQFIRLAQDWGLSPKLISQILIAGVHNSLGRAAALGNQQHRALEHFANAVAIGTPGADAKLLGQARSSEQLKQLGFFMQDGYLKVHAGASMPNVLSAPGAAYTGEALPLDEIHHAWQNGRWAFLAKLDNAELSGRPNRAEVVLYAACGYQQLDDMDGLQRCSRLAQEWGCSREKLKHYMAAGIRNTLAISDVLAGQYENAARSFTAALTVDHAKPKPQLVKGRVRRQLKNLKNVDIDQVFDTIANHIDEIITGTK